MIIFTGVAVSLAAAILIDPAPRAVSARVRAMLPGSCPRPSQAGGRAQLLPAAAGLACAGMAAVVTGWPVCLPVGVLSAAAGYVAARLLLRRRSQPRRDDAGVALRLASTWDLLAACLRAGLPVPAAIRAVAVRAPGPADAALLRTADLLALGADPVAAWAPALDCEQTVALARGARRTARSGSALADMASALAISVRDAAGDAAEASSARAGVLITGPLGLCFLPAFLCLGVVPVVIGLASRLLASW
ncbi:MAG: type II secretion system F family protein [Sciscionella sp.]